MRSREVDTRTPRNLDESAGGPGIDSDRGPPKPELGTGHDAFERQFAKHQS
jgi:hypothetical protein